MDIPGLITVAADQDELKDRLIALMGEAFETEPWTAEFFDNIRARADQRRELSAATMRVLIDTGAPVGRVYCNEHGTACAIAYRRSEQEFDNMHYEDLASEVLEQAECIERAQRPLVSLAQTMLWPVSDFEWYPDVVGDGDFIHLVDLGVEKRLQRTGVFKTLMRPFMDYADAHGLPVFLETYADDLEEIYEHYGFETLTVLDSPTAKVKQRCMMRRPTKRG